MLNGTRPLVAETPAPLKQRILRRVQSESSLCKPSPVQPTLHMCRGNCSLDHLHHAGSAQVPGTDEGTLSIQMCHSERQQGSKRGVLGSKRGHGREVGVNSFGHSPDRTRVLLGHRPLSVPRLEEGASEPIPGDAVPDIPQHQGSPAGAVFQVGANTLLPRRSTRQHASGRSKINSPTSNPRRTRSNSKDQAARH